MDLWCGMRILLAKLFTATYVSYLHDQRPQDWLPQHPVCRQNTHCCVFVLDLQNFKPHWRSLTFHSFYLPFLMQNMCNNSNLKTQSKSDSAPICSSSCVPSLFWGACSQQSTYMIVYILPFSSSLYILGERLKRWVVFSRIHAYVHPHHRTTQEANPSKLANQTANQMLEVFFRLLADLVIQS